MSITVNYLIVSLLVALFVGCFTGPIAEKYIDFKLKQYEHNLYPQPISRLIIFIGSMVVGTVVCYFSLAYLSFWQLPFVIVFTLFSTVATVVDCRIRIIGNEMVLALLAVGFLYRFIGGGIFGLLDSCVSAIGIAIFFIATFIISKFIFPSIPPAGAGDFKLMMVVAFVLGSTGILTALLTSSIVLLIYIAIGFIRRKLFLQSSVPMAGFIMIGLLVALVDQEGKGWNYIVQYITEFL